MQIRKMKRSDDESVSVDNLHRILSSHGTFLVFFCMLCCMNYQNALQSGNETPTARKVSVEPKSSISSETILHSEEIYMRQRQQRRTEAVNCFNNLFVETREKIKYDYNHSLPVLSSVRRTKTSEVVVYFSFFKYVNMKDETNKRYIESKWYCDNHNVEARVARHKNRNLNNLKMYCPPGTTKLFMETPDAKLQKDLTYHLGPYLKCDDMNEALLPWDDQTKKHMIACTEVKFGANYDLIPQWVEYHRMIGIESFWVYLNDSYEKFLEEAPAVAAYFDRLDVRQFASIIPYEWTQELNDDRRNFYQHGEYHDCLVQAEKNGVTWVLFNDVDEYLTVMNPNQTLRELIDPYQDMAAVSADNMFFGAFRESRLGLTHYDVTKPRVLLRNFHRRGHDVTPKHARAKMLVRPENVEYLLLHKIVDGKPTHYMDPYTELRSSHFKGSGQCLRRVKDTYLEDNFASRLEERLAQVYRPANPYEYHPTKVDKNFYCPSS